MSAWFSDFRQKLQYTKYGEDKTKGLLDTIDELDEFTFRDMPGFKRIHTKENGNDITIFIKVSKDNRIQEVYVNNGKVYNAPSDLATWGCLGGIAVIVALVGWFLVSVVSVFMDGVETDTTPDNPYIEDFNGDGLGGTKEDHDIYHKYYK